MRLGIDFGTTRTVVAVVDRGNYPVVHFQTEGGDMQPWYPSLICSRGGDIRCGIEAQACQGEPDWHFLASFKRLLGDLAPETPVALGGVEIPVLDLLVHYLKHLRRDLCHRSNLDIKPNQTLEALIAVPANGNSNQRFLTLEAFRRAGFHILGMINEPSAAGIEFAHRHAANQWAVRKEYLLVYDLGGGTFDASVICRREFTHEVLTDEGIARLGGDDFDQLLMRLACKRAMPAGSLSDTDRFELLEECRRQKESLHPNTRKIAIDPGRIFDSQEPIIVTTEEFYAQCRPLVERTIEALETAIARVCSTHGVTWNDIAVVYLVGGSADLPIIGRLLRERYGRRVRRSPYPQSATAIGLAVGADIAAGHVLRERFTRHFGVWREAAGGSRIIFDSIFPKDTPLPERNEPPLERSRSYHPVHNIGCFRYLECSRLNQEGQPDGDITPWDEIVFPMEPDVHNGRQLESIDIRRSDQPSSHLVEEHYRCNAQGAIEVTIVNRTAGYQQTRRLRERSARKR
jgi:molecular chaperone DnaK